MRFLFFCLSATLLFAIEPAAYPGGIAIVPLGEYGQTAPTVYFDKTQVLTRRHDGQWTAFVGIPIDTKGNSTLFVSHISGDERLIKTTFHVGAKSYPTQRLNVDEKFVEFDQATLRRIEIEREEVKTAITTYNDDREGELLMRLPLTASISGYFGARRIFNAKPKRPHSGLDLAAVKGTPITAPQSGKVVLAKALFFCGNAVLLDHGTGMFSLFCHLDSTAIKKGDFVEQGGIIGTVGNTGRVTGAHLHWSVAMNGVWIDPLLLLSSDEKQAINKATRR